MSIFLGLLLVISVAPVQAFECNLESVNFEIKQMGKNLIDNGGDDEDFINAIDEYVKNSNPKNTQEKKLVNDIKKYKLEYVAKYKQLTNEKNIKEHIQKIVKDTKDKKEFIKIKQKVAIDNAFNLKHDAEFEITVLEYLVNEGKIDLIEKSIDDIEKKYSNFDEFKNTLILEEIKSSPEDLQTVKELKNDLKKKISDIKKSRDNYNDPREINNYLRWDPEICNKKYDYCRDLKIEYK